MRKLSVEERMEALEAQVRRIDAQFAEMRSLIDRLRPSESR